jgi:hypothetical protein
LILVLSLLAGVGWLYLLRSLGWFTLGPRQGDSLPLLHLAGFDGQPLVRVPIAWLLGGIVFGLALIRVEPWCRAVLAGGSVWWCCCSPRRRRFALAENLRLNAVLVDRAEHRSVVRGSPVRRRQRANPSDSQVGGVRLPNGQGAGYARTPSVIGTGPPI